VDCLDRLHAVGTRTYWTELGNGAGPDTTFDIVGGNIVVQTAYADAGQTFTVNYIGAPAPDSYPVRAGGPPPSPPPDRDPGPPLDAALRRIWNRTQTEAV
jgi:hypothetical protein